MPETPATSAPLGTQQLAEERETIRSLRHRANLYRERDPQRAKALEDEAAQREAALPPAEAAKP